MGERVSGIGDWDKRERGKLQLGFNVWEKKEWSLMIP